MADYEITITRAERNPFYKPAPTRGMYDNYHEDSREPQEREFDVRRVLHASLTDDEYDAVKRALVEHWTAAKAREATAIGSALVVSDGETQR